MTGKSNTQQKPKYQAGNYFTIHGSLEKGNPSPGAMGETSWEILGLSFK